MSPTNQVAFVLGIWVRVRAGMSQIEGAGVLGGLSIFGRHLLGLGGAAPTVEQKGALDNIPRSIQTIEDNFKLTGRTVTYAVCPACHCTYKPVLKPSSRNPEYPDLCSHNPEPGRICGESLVDENQKPFKTFVYHSFKDYVASLLVREDIEDAVDDFCEAARKPPPDEIKDVCDARFVREFLGPDGRLFVDRPGSEARLLFALNVDFFSVEGNSLRGATESAGIIAMTCLNIPGNLRVDNANLYLGGIIPGPYDPNHDQIGHYIWPLMEDLAEAFEKGVKYNRTARYPAGRSVRSAVAAAVMDFPAGRSTNGLSSVTT